MFSIAYIIYLYWFFILIRKLFTEKECYSFVYVTYFLLYNITAEVNDIKEVNNHNKLLIALMLGELAVNHKAYTLQLFTHSLKTHSSL